MEKYFITFRSVTYAQKGERILKEQRIRCILQRTPRWMEYRGCGYALEVRDPKAAVKALAEKGADWKKLYRLSGDTIREVEEP